MEINGLQILFQMINFGVVFGAVVVLLYKPIMKMLDERAAKVEEAERVAAAAMSEKEEIDSLKKKARTQSEKDAAKVLEKATEDAKELKAKLTKEVKEEVATLREKEMKKWEAQMKAAQEAMEKKVTELSVAVASKVLGAEIDAKTHKSLIAQSIKELEKAL